MDLQIRDATAEDSEQLLSLLDASYRDVLSDEERAASRSWTTEGHLIEGPRISDAEALSKELEGLLVGVLGDRIVACIQSRVDSGKCSIGLFSVHPTTQNLGYGDKMLRAAEAKGTGHVAQIWVIDVRNELIAWYKRRGYVEVDVPKIDFSTVGDGVGKPRKEYEGAIRFQVFQKQL